MLAEKNLMAEGSFLSTRSVPCIGTFVALTVRGAGWESGVEVMRAASNWVRSSSSSCSDMSESGLVLRASSSAASSGDSWLYLCLPELQLFHYLLSSSSDTPVSVSRYTCALRARSFFELGKRRAAGLPSFPLGVIVC